MPHISGIGPQTGKVRALVPGQRLDIEELATEGQIEVTLELTGGNLSALRPVCLSLGCNQQVLDGREVVHQSRPISTCGGVRFVQEGASLFRFCVSLGQLSPGTGRLLIVLGLLRGHVLEHGVIRLGGGGKDWAAYSFQACDFPEEKALCLLELYKKGTWRALVPGGGFRGGLPALFSNYGAHQDTTAAVEQPAPSPPVQRHLDHPWLPSTRPGDRVPAIPEALLPAVGQIICTSDDGSTFAGTGFVVGPGGLVLTCAHVVADATSAKIMLGGSSVMRDLEFVAADLPSDVALLHIPDHAGVPHWLMLESPECEPRLGAALGILGYPLGLKLGLDVSYCEGIVNSLRSVDGIRVLQIDAGAAPGSSGAPVFSRTSGKVMGILTSGLNLSSGGMHVNFAVDIRVVWNLGWFDRTVQK